MIHLIANNSEASSSTLDGEVLIRVENVSKKFCRNLKKSLWYGVQDIAAELNPFMRKSKRRANRDSLSGELPVAVNELSDRVNEEQFDNTSPLRDEEFWGVKNVSFELRRGECLGLIGRNGAGKTTLLKMLNGLIKPDFGRITMRGRVGALIALGAGFNPILTGRENIYINGAILGLSKLEIDEKLDDIIEFADIHEFIDAPVQSYSSGMQTRLGFAVATALNPDILLLDEVLAVGDIGFRMKCFERIGRLISRACVIFVSHEWSQVRRICDRCLYLKFGSSVHLGSTEQVLNRYLEDQVSGQNVSHLILDEEITSFSCLPSATRIEWGDHITFELDLQKSRSTVVGLCLIALLDGDASVAQCEIPSTVFNAASDKLHVRLNVGPISLRNGSYGLAVTILDESRKRTLVHAIRCCEFTVEGPRGYGVLYQIACSISS